MKNENKKIKNATETTVSGINFKSRIEGKMYEYLVKEGFSPKYEDITFTIMDKLRPTVPFYNRIKKALSLDMKPLLPITYTPDFTFYYNDILIILEIKGFENDTFPLKKKLFRKFLETFNKPVMFFEIRTKKELLVAINKIRMEDKSTQKIRKLIPCLPEKDIPLGYKLLEDRNWEELDALVLSDISKVEKAHSKETTKYDNIDLASLYELKSLIPEYE